MKFQMKYKILEWWISHPVVFARSHFHDVARFITIVMGDNTRGSSYLFSETGDMKTRGQQREWAREKWEEQAEGGCVENLHSDFASGHPVINSITLTCLLCVPPLSCPLFFYSFYFFFIMKILSVVQSLL